MASPRVSVITIFYDAERFISEAIDSVLAQDFADFELLLVDDGSRDGGTALAREYEQRHPGKVRYLEHPGHTNRGMSATRNLGIAHAAGEYVAFTDADDVWRPHKLREQVAILDAHPEVGMVCGTVNYWSSWEGGEDVPTPTGHVRDAVSNPPETSLALYPLGRAGAPCPSDIMLRKEAIERLGGFEAHFTRERQMYEDQAFFGKLYLAWPVYFASNVWLDYRVHPDSCVASVRREGQYGEVRRFFLDWYRPYVAASDAPGKDRVLRAIDRARWKLDHPGAARVLRGLARLTGA